MPVDAYTQLIGKFRMRLEAMGKAGRDGGKKVAKAAIETAKARAEQYSPIDTGALRSSYSVRYGGNQWGGNASIWNDAPYFWYMEHGFTTPDGSWWEGHHMLETSINLMASRLQEKFDLVFTPVAKVGGFT